MPTIKTFARIKPCKNAYDDFDVTKDRVYLRTAQNRDYNTSPTKTRANTGTVNHEFKFDTVFSSSTVQEEVFETAAKDIVDHFLTGYNATIFAYGQTGSGKTFTVEGSARRYEDRGLAPRALSMIYKALESRQDEDISVHISYMEIYQEVGYDLLNPGARTNSLVTPFPKVVVVEGPKGSCIVRNLSSHMAANEEVAQNLLLQGQANRKVGETPMNQRSSRSHAVFTVTLSTKKPDSDIVVKSKLHLVDLAGSERVAKTGVSGLQLTEAKYINLSLHYLEGVIIALQKEAQGGSQGPMRSHSSYGTPANRNHPYTSPRKSRNASWVSSIYSGYGGRPSTSDGRYSTHVPYRNSLLTMMLRDSLGGNCLTVMIATLSMEEENLGETISTCRFAQRVACIANNAKKNEEIDDKSMIQRLRKRIAELEAEVANLKALQYQSMDGETLAAMMEKLTDEDKITCSRLMQQYIVGKVKDPVTAGVTDPFKFRECLRILKEMIMKKYAGGQNNGTGVSLSEAVKSRPISNTSGISTATSGFDETMPGQAEKEPRPFSSPAVSKIQRAVSDDQLARPATAYERPTDMDYIDIYRDPVMNNLVKPTPSASSPRNSDTIDSKPRKTPEPYKSPFERKKEKEIKKLNKKVEKTFEDQLEQQHHLIEFQASIKEQQLELIEKELSNKLEATRTQVTNQQSYLIQLKQSRADPELLAQEKLVERQLRKREAKLDSRLKIIRQQKSEIQEAYKSQKEALHNSARTESPRRVGSSLEEKFQQYVKRDGKLNSRQVLDMLSQQDKDQEKLQSKIEKSRVLSLSKQLEIKEVSTRQKLQEFKERLKQAKLGNYSFDSSDSISSPDKTGQSVDTNSFLGSVNDRPTTNMSSYSDSQDTSVSYQESRDSSTPTVLKPKMRYAFGELLPPTPEVPEHESPRQREFSPISSHPAVPKINILDLENDASMSESINDRHKPNHMRDGSVSPRDVQKTPRNPRKNIFILNPERSPERHNKSGGKSTDKWESAYRYKSPERSMNFDNMSGIQGRATFQFSDFDSIASSTDPLAQYSGQFITSSPFQKTASHPSNSSAKYQNNHHKSPSNDNTYTHQQRSRDQDSVITNTSKESSRSGRSPERNGKKYRTQYYKALRKAQKHGKRANFSKFDLDRLDMGSSSSKRSQAEDYDRSFEKYTPSEYVQNTNTSFDARKMGLSSKSFDSTLASMLGKEALNAQYTSDIYNQFANTNSPRGQHQSRSPERRRDKVNSQSKSPARSRGRSRNESPDSRDRKSVSPTKSRAQNSRSSNSPSRSSGWSRSKDASPSRNNNNKTASGKERGRKNDRNKERRETSPSRNSWGPEAKNKSISESLEKFLTELPPSTSKLRHSGIRSLDDSDIPTPRPAARKDFRVQAAENKPKLVEFQECLEEYHPKIKALPDQDRENKFMSVAREQKDRVTRIRKARHAAEVIQRAWKRYKTRKR
ncbi:kinesin-like protein KIF16B isoform X2 [Lingula anatina]|uniref:Kinesin-like protein KIF16B isoform X2 n=1 Tax=Lingula anatina TaxID=7574 RepID=A0A1S3HUP9_LINAN|nr:kinesin-like protein KIF16B isoform X2 [Lingula anatina]|eukprot:XP_013389271.1 kinesin-like protein KIF16B isoform X2 [Lingula anatina]